MSGDNGGPDERERLLSVAREASAFLNSWFPQTDRFIEATLPLDAALNAVLLDGDHPGLLEFWGSDCEACEGNTTAGSMRCDDCGSRQHTVALYSVRRTDPGRRTSIADGDAE